MHNASTFPVYKDAFSSGQITSKIWLCEELEKLRFDDPVIWLYGGWHAMTAFLLLSRNNMKINSIRSFDIDPNCEITADSILENWVWQDWKFKAFTIDCNYVDPTKNEFGSTPSIIINTSTEHFESTDWFDHIPEGTIVVLQSNNMPHTDHCACYDTLNDFQEAFPLKSLDYSGQKDFIYPNWQFSRFMIIGKK